MTQSTAPGDAFNDSLNFVKKLWGQMGVPGMTPTQGMSIPGMAGMQVPSMSLEDLDKRIQELKTVETWLNLNTTMLRNTIQAMEVQRATIATLHSLSNTMANTMQGMGAAAAHSAPVEEEEQPVEGDEPVAPILEQSAAWWQGVQDQFKQALGTALEKSAASFDAVKSASATMAKPPSAKKPAARKKTASKPKAAARAPAARARKAG